MDSAKLTHKQIETVEGQVKVRAGYFKTLADKLGFRLGDSDQVIVAAREAHEKTHALWTRLHYLSMEAFSREFDAEERQAKMRRRFRR
jgi:hypothetical protein